MKTKLNKTEQRVIKNHERNYDLYKLKASQSKNKQWVVLRQTVLALALCHDETWVVGQFPSSISSLQNGLDGQVDRRPPPVWERLEIPAWSGHTTDLKLGTLVATLADA